MARRSIYFVFLLFNLYFWDLKCLLFTKRKQLMKKIISLVLGIIALTGCATKQYPQAPTVTGEESAVFDCGTVQQEIARVRSIQQEIESTGKFDGRTVLGFLGDFGIGNGIAKDEARKKAESRLIQLQAIQAGKCSQSVKPA